MHLAQISPYNISNTIIPSWNPIISKGLGIVRPLLPPRLSKILIASSIQAVGYLLHARASHDVINWPILVIQGATLIFTLTLNHFNDLRREDD